MNFQNYPIDSVIYGNAQKVDLNRGSFFARTARQLHSEDNYLIGLANLAHTLDDIFNDIDFAKLGLHEHEADIKTHISYIKTLGVADVGVMGNTLARIDYLRLVLSHAFTQFDEDNQHIVGQYQAYYESYEALPDHERVRNLELEAQYRKVKKGLSDIEASLNQLARLQEELKATRADVHQAKEKFKNAEAILPVHCDLVLMDAISWFSAKVQEILDDNKLPLIKVDFESIAKKLTKYASEEGIRDAKGSLSEVSLRAVFGLMSAELKRLSIKAALPATRAGIVNPVNKLAEDWSSYIRTLNLG